MSGFMVRLLGRRSEALVEPPRPAQRIAVAPAPDAQLVSLPESPRPEPRANPPEPAAAGALDAPETPPAPLPFGQNGEKIGEHIAYFLSRLDQVYNLRSEFASVADPMQAFVRSHHEVQTRLTEMSALLAREGAEAQASRAESFVLNAAHNELENARAEATNQLKLVGETAETRGHQLRALQIAHDDVTARLDWATQQLAVDAQNSRDQADPHPDMSDDLAKSAFGKAVLFSRPPPDERRAGGNYDEGLGDGGKLLIVASEAAVLNDPGEGSLHALCQPPLPASRAGSPGWLRPASRQHLEAFRRGVATDDLQDDVGLVLRPCDEATRVAIGVGALHEGVSRSRALQDTFAAVSILDVGAMDLHGGEASVGIGQDVALASADFLTRVVAVRAPF